MCHFIKFTKLFFTIFACTAGFCLAFGFSVLLMYASFHILVGVIGEFLSYAFASCLATAFWGDAVISLTKHFMGERD
jgi:hypothetical protein